MGRKSQIDKKLYYKIGEACKVLDIQPYVLRYWETEFPFLQPSKSRSGQRVYSERELRLIQRIKELLYDEGYTIAGAKKKLEKELESNTPLPEPTAPSQASSTPSSSQPTKRKPASRPSPETTPSQAVLDSGVEERIERMRQGIEEALNKARELLSYLESRRS